MEEKHYPVSSLSEEERERLIVSRLGLSNDAVYVELERVKKENYKLRKMLEREKDVNRGQSKKIAKLEKALKKANKELQQFRGAKPDTYQRQVTLELLKMEE